MSRENVEFVRRMVARGDPAWRRGDEAELKAHIKEFFAREVVMRLVDAPAGRPQTFHGQEATLAQWAAMTEVFDDFHREVGEFVDADEWVVTVGHWSGRGKASGVVVTAPTASAFRVRDGKVVEYIVGFPSKDAALEAVG
jgi:ketosteroid isomerase-like protein